MPLSSSASFLAGVFCLFGALILVASSPQLQSAVRRGYFLDGLSRDRSRWSGLMLATRDKYWIFAILFPLQFLTANYLLGKHSSPHASLEGNLPALNHRLMLDAGSRSLSS